MSFPVQLGFGDCFQILVLAVAVYYVLNLFRRTRSAQMLWALAAIVVFLSFMGWVTDLQVLGWILAKFVVYAAFALVVIFQPEIRQTLASIGRNWRTRSHSASSSDRFLDSMVDVVSSLARTRTGALIAIERQICLDPFCENGTILGAPFVPKLVGAIFFPNAPLHDGGVIIRGETILAARCVFPLSQREDIGYGMRHRAALGLSEQTDAVMIVVSEESGSVSIAYEGRLIHDLTPEHLRRYLAILMPKEKLADTLMKALDKLETERRAELASSAGGQLPIAGKDQAPADEGRDAP